jgi:hypothetical protein
MSDRYSLVNTQVIDPNIDAGHSKEFLELRGIDVIAKVPYKDKVSLFYRDAEKNILYGDFILGDNEYYEGSSRVITYQYLKDSEDIHIKSSFYRPGEYFYFFYENNGNIYVRVFKKKQGSLGEEILVREKSKISSINSFKENYVIIIEDDINVELAKKGDISDKGELKILFVYENDINKKENREDENLHFQEFDVPFNDIPEKLYSIENQVENEKAEIYITGEPKLVKMDGAINGVVCFDYDKVITTMDHDKDFSIILRYRPNHDMGDGYTFLETNNFSIKQYFDKLRIELSNGEVFDSNKVILDNSDGVTQSSFHNIILSINSIGDKKLINIGHCLDTYLNSQFIFNSFVVEDQLFKVDEKVLTINHSIGIDYLAIKNDSIPQRVMNDLFETFIRDLYSGDRVINETLEASNIEGIIRERLDRKKESNIYLIPPEAEDIYFGEEIIANDRILIADDSIKYEISDDVRKGTFYVKTNGFFNNNKMDEFVVYAKKNSFIDANHRKGLIIYETGAALRNIENADLIKLDTLYLEDVEDDVVNRVDSYLDTIGGNVLASTNYSDFITASVNISAGISYAIDENTFTPNYNEQSFFSDKISLSICEKEYETTVTNISGHVVSDMIPVNRFIYLDDGSLLDMEQNIVWAIKPIYVTQLKETTYINDNNIEEIIQSNINRKTIAEFETSNTFIHGTNNWRLPNSDEMMSILKFIQSTPNGTVDVPGIYYNDDGDSVGAFENCVDETILKEEISTLNNFTISSTIFDVDDYNNLDVTDRGLVKNDSIWTSDNKRIRISNQTSLEDDLFNGCPATLVFLVRRDVPEFGIRARYSDGESFIMPKIKGETFSFDKEGDIVFEKTHNDLEFFQYEINYTKRIGDLNHKDIKYFNHEHTNSNNRYNFGKDVNIKKKSKKYETNNTVFPVKLKEEFNIHKYLFQDPEENIRISEHESQRDGFTPFKIEYDNLVKDIVLWTTLDNVHDKIVFQYDLLRKEFFYNAYEEYDITSKRTYNQESYFSAFHFNSLDNKNHRLIKDIVVDDNGEIMLLGKTKYNVYAREIKKINFFGIPKKYKSNNIRVEIDVAYEKDIQSYINNYDEIESFVLRVIDSWKPANVLIDKLVERETLVMAKLLQDEYVQVLVGLTPLDNFNAYYNRTFDTREVSIKTSSDVSTDKVNWIGIPQLNRTFLKSGITKVINEKKNIKINFETPYANNNYRVFAFSPYDANFYTIKKDREGFIVESSSTVKNEVSWITLSTSEIINGTLKWNKGLPNGDLMVDHFDRISEISVYSNTYTVNFTDFGYELQIIQ